MGYGKSKYGSEQKFQKTGKPAKGPGDNIIRIMPAMHSLADEGRWALYFTTHWGYAGVSGGDPTKTVVRPFRCIEDKDRRSGLVRQACPECDNFRAAEAEAEAFEAKLKSEGKSEAEVKTAMKSRNDWLQAHAPERKWYINVMYENRTFGDYKINHKTHKKGIDAKIAELWENLEIDATDLSQGVWFNIKRLGDGFSVPDVVEVVQEAVPGKKGQFAIKMAPLTEEEAARGLKECRDLATLGGAVLTEAQIQALVDCDGSPEAVDAIFGARPKAEPQQARRPIQVDDRDEGDERPVTTGHSEPAKTTGKAIEQVTDALQKFTGALKEAVATTPAKGPTPEELKAKAEAIMARKKAEAEAKAAAEKAAAEAAAAAAAAPAVNPLELNDDDFLKFFNSQQAAQ